MAKGILLGVPPSEYERLTPRGVKELFSRLSKEREREGKADADRHNAEFDAVMKAVGNLQKGINNTNELLAKIVRKPTL